MTQRGKAAKKKHRVCVDATTSLRATLDSQAAPPPLAINIHTEPRARACMLLWIDEGITSESEIIPAAAEETGVSIETIRRYLAKMTSFRGPLKRTTNEQGIVHLSRR